MGMGCTTFHFPEIHASGLPVAGNICTGAVPTCPPYAVRTALVAPARHMALNPCTHWVVHTALRCARGHSLTLSRSPHAHCTALCSWPFNSYMPIHPMHHTVYVLNLRKNLWACSSIIIGQYLSPCTTQVFPPCTVRRYLSLAAVQRVGPVAYQQGAKEEDEAVNCAAPAHSSNDAELLVGFVITCMAPLDAFRSGEGSREEGEGSRGGKGSEKVGGSGEGDGVSSPSTAFADLQGRSGSGGRRESIAEEAEDGGGGEGGLGSLQAVGFGPQTRAINVCLLVSIHIRTCVSHTYTHASDDWEGGGLGSLQATMHGVWPAHTRHQCLLGGEHTRAHASLSLPMNVACHECDPPCRAS